MAQEKMLAMQQDDEDGEGDGAAVVDHLHERAAVGCYGSRVRDVFLEESKGEGPEHSY